MKQIFILFALFSSLSITIQAQVKIGGSGSPHPNAVLELDGGLDKGLLLPRHTTAEMNSMNNIPDGMMIFNTTLGKIHIRRAGVWEIADGITLPLDKSYTVDNNYVLKLVNLSSNDDYGAIIGQAGAGKGVVGWSDSGYGTLAHSNSGIAMFADASTGTALYASSGSGPAITTGNGNVGIGVSNPTTPIHVKRPTSSLMQLENSLNLLSGTRTDLLFKTGTYYTGVISTIGSNATTARIGFHTGAHTSSGFLIERMSIANNGNVGINNNTPSEKLDVVGTAEFNSSGGEPAVKVNGTAQFTQNPGDEAAVNINGRIKTSGANPRAFIVTANATTNEIVLDHPDLNSNPNAIILVTPRWIQGDIKFSGTIVVEYKTSISKWALKAVGSTVNYFQQLDIKTCSGACEQSVDIFNMVSASFDSGDQFNVLVIGN